MYMKLIREATAGEMNWDEMGIRNGREIQWLTEHKNKKRKWERGIF